MLGCCTACSEHAWIKMLTGCWWQKGVNYSSGFWSWGPGTSTVPSGGSRGSTTKKGNHFFHYNYIHKQTRQNIWLFWGLVAYTFVIKHKNHLIRDLTVYTCTYFYYVESVIVNSVVSQHAKGYASSLHWVGVVCLGNRANFLYMCSATECGTAKQEHSVSISVDKVLLGENPEHPRQGDYG